MSVIPIDTTTSTMFISVEFLVLPRLGMRIVTLALVYGRMISTNC
jgi:uncharacterized membrane protein YdcZ (DUF606 family)